MRTLMILVLPVFGFGQPPMQMAIVNGTPPVPPSFTMTLVHHTLNASCTGASASCTVTAPATTAGNLLVLISSGYTTVVARTYSSASGDSSWTHCPSSYSTIVAQSIYNIYSDCAYILNATGGATSFVFTWSGTNVALAVELLEISRTSGTWTYDTSGNTTSAGCTACAAVALTLSGTNDYITQFGIAFNNVTSISSPYSSPADIGPAAVGSAVGGVLDTSSGSAPTFNQTPSTAAQFGAVAFK